MDENQKTSLINGFSNVVRQSQLPGIDVQRLSMAFRMTLDALAPGQAIELQPLVDYLVGEQKAPEKSVIELCVILKDREQRLGITFTPPQKALLPYLSPEQAEKIVAAFNARVEKALGAWDKSGEVALPRGTPGQPAPRTVEPKIPAKGDKGPRSRTPIYAGALVLAVAAAIGFYAWRGANGEPEMRELPLPDGAGLKCTSFTSNGAVGFCEIPLARANATPMETLKAKAALTKSAAHLRTLYVRTREDRAIILKQ